MFKTQEVVFRGVELVVGFDFQPREEPDYDVESPSVGPGCDAAAEISSVKHRGVEIIELLSEDTLADLEQVVCMAEEEMTCD